ncbi:hypothetical protein IJR75_00270 [bacterium]|nr:hypothetical protein [bacterium]
MLKISKATDSDFIKHLEDEIDKLKIDIEHNNQELIPFYLEHLGDDSYTNWEGFN